MPRIHPSTAKPAAGQGTVTLDDLGDLRLVVGSGDEMSKFIVCSRSLSRSSPVFKAMLYGSFRESRPADPSANPWVVELPDDLATPAAILLGIIHGRFSMVDPKVGTLDGLYQILAFADKYDMVSLLAPWIQGWVEDVSPLQGPRPLDTTWTIWKAIAVSRQIGALRPMRELVRRIVMTAESNSNGELLFEGSLLQPPGSHEMPLSSPETTIWVSKHHRWILYRILNMLRALVLDLRTAINSNGGDGAICCVLYLQDLDPGSEASQCHSATLGFILSAMDEEEVKVLWAPDASSDLPPQYPWAPDASPDLPAQYPFSVQHLVEKIKSISANVSNSARHGPGCNPLPPMIKYIDDFIDVCSCRLPDDMVASLERQRTRYGELDGFC
ncbi:hypothetical protein QBC39DRAFT_302763 [Podospora conica]|nr:hypothetical protein QBC39DRAFT_302763 [Schizothecium conicum]